MGEVRRDDGKRNMFWRSARSWSTSTPVPAAPHACQKCHTVADLTDLGLKKGIRRLRDNMKDMGGHIDCYRALHGRWKCSD